MDDLQLKLPPHSIDAEQSLIGAILHDNRLIDKIYDLRPEDFYQHDHKKIYSAMVELYEKNKPVDVVTLADVLESKKLLNDCGGLKYLVGLATNSHGSGNAKRYAEIIQEKATLRSLIMAAAEIQEAAYNNGDAQKQLDKAQSTIMAISDNRQHGDPKKVSEILPSRVERIDAAFSGNIKAISTGLSDLDEKLGGGFEGGDLVIIAGRPAMGKTALAVQIAEHIQNQEGCGLIFTCEMPNGQIVDRLISTHASIASNIIRSGKLKDEDWEGLTMALGKLDSMNLYVDDTSYTMSAIASKSRSIKRKHGLSVVVVDYLQLLSGSGETRDERIGNISRGLKALAKELDVPILALSQLNRGLESRSDKRPIMSDLRESGAIEQDADTIIFIYRDEVYNQDSHDKGTAELIVGKQRRGSTGRVRVTFIGEHTVFKDFSGAQVWADLPSNPKKGYARGFE